MDQFRDYYLRNIMPQLKKMERARKGLLIKALTIMGIAGILITPVVFIICLRSKSLNSLTLYFLLPIPAAFLLKKPYSNFAKSFKQTIIQGFFLEFFDRFSIETLVKKDDNQLYKTGLFPVKDKHILESEDFITVWQDDKKLNSLK